MRIAELSRASGVSIPSIKFYLRNELLQPGIRTAPNQATYDTSHIHRLRLIRALIDVGGLSVATVRQLLDAIDRDDVSLHKALGMALYATVPNPPTDADTPDDATIQAQTLVTNLVKEQGWTIRPNSEGMSNLVSALAAMIRVQAPRLTDLLTIHTNVINQLAEKEVQWAFSNADSTASHINGPDRSHVVEMAVIGTVLGEAVLTALRRFAHENVSNRHHDATHRTELPDSERK